MHSVTMTHATPAECVAQQAPVFETPYYPRTGQVNGVCLVRVHPGEWGTEAFRSEYLSSPVGGFALLDGNPTAALQGVRCTNDVEYYGNLTTQFSPERKPRPGETPNPAQLAARAITRARAQTLRALLPQYEHVVDVHGCGTHYASLAWLNQTPTKAELAIAYALNPRMAVVTDTLTVGTLGSGVLAELADEDYAGLHTLRNTLGALAAGTLQETSMQDMRAMTLYKYVGCLINLTPQDCYALQLQEHYSYMDRLPESVSAVFCPGKPAYALTTGKLNSEIITPLTAEEQDAMLKQANAA